MIVYSSGDCYCLLMFNVSNFHKGGNNFIEVKRIFGEMHRRVGVRLESLRET
jgi:hypothetical protein